MYCRVALSDLTSAAEERCHGGQTHWDACVKFFFSLNGARKKVFVTVRIILLVCCA